MLIPLDQTGRNLRRKAHRLIEKDYFIEVIFPWKYLRFLPFSFKAIFCFLPKSAKNWRKIQKPSSSNLFFFLGEIIDIFYNFYI